MDEMVVNFMSPAKLARKLVAEGKVEKQQPYNIFLSQEEGNKLEQLFEFILTLRERQVLFHYYTLDNATFRIIGALLGISTSRVGKIHRTALDKLKEPYCIEKLKNFIE